MVVFGRESEMTGAPKVCLIVGAVLSRGQDYVCVGFVEVDDISCEILSPYGNRAALVINCIIYWSHTSNIQTTWDPTRKSVDPKLNSNWSTGIFCHVVLRNV